MDFLAYLRIRSPLLGAVFLGLSCMAPCLVGLISLNQETTLGSILACCLRHRLIGLR
jgi:uncharacterized membrane protein